MVNLYKPYFQKNQKVFHPSTFPPLNQTQMRKTKNFSILPLFSILSLLYPHNQKDPKMFIKRIKVFMHVYVLMFNTRINWPFQAYSNGGIELILVYNS